MVGRVRAAGAIVVGKTNVPEFGAGANSRNFVWGATGNPFNPLLNAGGSSGGAAVALAWLRAQIANPSSKATYREGALDPKTMQLVALAAMAAAGCTS